MIVHVTDAALIESMWPSLELLFEKVTPTTNGCWEAVDILYSIRRGEQQLWVAVDERGTPMAAMTTKIIDHPRRRVVQVPFIAGSRMREWAEEFTKAIEAYARREGSTLMEGFFRRGWVRMWPGSHEHGVWITKELTA